MKKSDFINCLETISVRVAKQHDFDAALKLCSEASLPSGSAQFSGMSIYRTDGFESDLIVHIHWSFESSTQKKTLLGKQLAIALSRYGIVRHALLINQQVKFPGMQPQARINI